MEQSPLARGWNVYLKAVRTELPTSRKLRELAICTVALLTAPSTNTTTTRRISYRRRRTQSSWLRSAGVVAADPRRSAADPALGKVEQLVIRYAAQMTRDVTVDDALFAALQQHFDTTQIVELTNAIATYNMVARFLVALGVSPGRDLNFKRHCSPLALAG